MGRRNDQISRSIIVAILEHDDLSSKPLGFWKPVKSFFALFGLLLIRIRPDLFEKLRIETWNLTDQGYKDSFNDKDALVMKGDMGYSGSVGRPR